MKLIKSDVLKLAVEAGVRLDKVLTLAVAFEDNGDDVDSKPTHFVLVVPYANATQFTGNHLPLGVDKTDFE
jgi:hypothetical protein